MAAGELKEAWCCLKGWYSTVEDCAPKASHDTLVIQTEERIALYARAPFSGEMLPINVQPFDINDGIPRDSEIRGSCGTGELLEQWNFKPSTLRCGCGMWCRRRKNNQLQGGAINGILL
jgi:hypothetical protein